MLVKQIKDEVDEADELKESEADVKRKIQLVEDQVLNGEVCTKKAKKIKPAQGWGTRKDINGVITGENLSRTSSQNNSIQNSGGSSKSLDEALFQFLEAKPKGQLNISTLSSSATCLEEIVEEKMFSWAANQGKDVYQVLLDIKMEYDNSLFSAIDSVSVDILISIYCTRGSNFSASLFKESLEKEGFSSLVSHKLYHMLNKWRAAACAVDTIAQPNFDNAIV